MNQQQEKRPRRPAPPPILADHPESLGDLAPLFERHRIAMAADASGEMVLVRPDSGVIDTGTTDESFAKVMEVLERNRELVEFDARVRRTRSGLLRFTIPGVDPEDRRGERRFGVRRLATVLARLRREGLSADPNHVMLASQGVSGSPVGVQAHFTGGMMWTAEVHEVDGKPMLRSTSDPAPAPHPSSLSRPLDLPGRRRPTVLVLDTGLRTVDAAGAAVEHPDLEHCLVVHRRWRLASPGLVDDEDEIDDDASGHLDFEAGHGTFIAGVVRQVCPDAEVHIAGVLSSFGAGDVATVIEAFERAIGNAGRALRPAGCFDLVVMSFGGYMTDDEGSSFGRALGRLLGSGLGISAAGNQATSRRYFPAALADVVGVGALHEDHRAWFSNFGGWVDACAPGVDVVSTFFFDVTDPAIGDHPARSYGGWARWSGTSFAAPKVAGALAQEMYLTDVPARTAWRRMSHHQRYRVPDLGTVFNV